MKNRLYAFSVTALGYNTMYPGRIPSLRAKHLVVIYTQPNQQEEHQLRLHSDTVLTVKRLSYKH
jgi:hypothetical protein